MYDDIFKADKLQSPGQLVPVNTGAWSVIHLELCVKLIIVYDDSDPTTPASINSHQLAKVLHGRQKRNTCHNRTILEVSKKKIIFLRTHS